MFASEYIKKMKELEENGRCLHFDSGERCNQIIGAHSIQKSGQLKSIIENNHVTHIDPRMGSLIKNDGVLSATKISWKKVSTFNGFCQNHDNELFEPIDNVSLAPNERQVMLYAYRCLCREYFVKENSCLLAKKYYDDPKIVSSILKPHYEGTKYGFLNLKSHKNDFDKSLSNNSYRDITYVCFISEDNWHAQFSGVLYPDVDFIGNKLQNLADLERKLDLITFFTAPIGKGRAFVFAWHKSSDDACRQLLSSLTESIHSGSKTEDNIFRFSVSCCENHAFRTSWWNGLKEEKRNNILNRVNLMAAPGVPIPSTYLSNGLEGVASWSFGKVASNM